MARLTEFLAPLFKGALKNNALKRNYTPETLVKELEPSAWRHFKNDENTRMLRNTVDDILVRAYVRDAVKEGGLLIRNPQSENTLLRILADDRGDKLIFKKVEEITLSQAKAMPQIPHTDYAMPRPAAIVAFLQTHGLHTSDPVKSPAFLKPLDDALGINFKGQNAPVKSPRFLQPLEDALEANFKGARPENVPVREIRPRSQNYGPLETPKATPLRNNTDSSVEAQINHILGGNNEPKVLESLVPRQITPAAAPEVKGDNFSKARVYRRSDLPPSQ